MTTRVLSWPDSPRWTMDVQLSGQVYTFSAHWNTRSKTWVIDMDTVDGVRLLYGVRVVLDYPLLPEWRTDEMPPGELFVVDPSATRKTDPGRESIGVDNETLRFVYVEPE